MRRYGKDNLNLECSLKTLALFKILVMKDPGIMPLARGRCLMTEAPRRPWLGWFLKVGWDELVQEYWRMLRGEVDQWDL